MGNISNTENIAISKTLKAELELLKKKIFIEINFRNMFGVFEGDNSRTKIFIKNEKMKLESLEDTRLGRFDSLLMYRASHIIFDYLQSLTPKYALYSKI